MDEWLDKCGGGSTAGLRSGRAAGVILMALALFVAAFWFANSGTQLDDSDATPVAHEADPMHQAEPQSPNEALSSVQELPPTSTARTTPLARRVPAAPAPLDTQATQRSDSEGPATVVALSGQVDLYVGGRLSQLRLNGSIGVSAHGTPWTTTKLMNGQFELVLHRQPSGEYATADQALNVGSDLERVRFNVAAPRADETGKLLLYNIRTNAPWRYAGAIPIGTTNAVVSVTEAPTIDLEVLERGTNIHLDRVCVVAVSSENGQLQRRSGRGKVRLAWFEGSPMTLNPGDPLSHSKSTVIAVSAPGYGSREIAVDFTHPHARVVELSAGGSLVVRIDGELPPGSELLFYSQEGTRDRHEARSGETRYDSLTPATYRALVLSSDRPGMTRLASGQVKVRPNETAELTLTIPSAESLARADLAGTLVLPEAWAIRDRRINGRLLGRAKSVGSQSFAIGHNDLVPTQGHPGSYTFEKKDLEVGRYVLELAALGVQTIVDLPPEGVRDVEFIVAPPVNMTVVLRDADSGGDFARQIDTVFWSPKSPDAARVFTSKSIRRSTNSGKFHLTVPAGEVSLHAGTQFFSERTLDVFAIEGLEVVLPVTSPMTAKLELRDGEVIIPWPANAMLSGQDASGRQVQTTYSSSGASTFEVQKGGTYWIKIPRIDGFLPHDHVAVDFAPGPEQKVVVQLTRR